MKINIPSVSMLAPGETLEMTIGAVTLAWTAARKGAAADWPGSIFLWGPVGIGKTTTGHLLGRLPALTSGREPWRELLLAILAGDGERLIREARRLPETAGPLIRIQVQTAEPPDVRGAPRIREVDGVEWTFFAPPADFMPVLRHPWGVVLIDDYPQGLPEVQRALASLIGEGRLPAHLPGGEFFRLPPGWRVLATGNFPGRAHGAFPVGDFLRNRAVHLHLSAAPVPPETEAALPGASPEAAAAVHEEAERWLRISEFHPLVVAFIEVHPEWMGMSDHEGPQERLAFPSLRSWGMVSQIVWEAEGIPVSSREAARRLEIAVSLAVYGAVGAEAAQAFLDFWKALRGARLPTPREIMTAGEVAPLPDPARPGEVFYALRAAEAALLAAFQEEGREGAEGLIALGRSLGYFARVAGVVEQGLGMVDLIAHVLARMLREAPGFAAAAARANPEAWRRLSGSEALRRVVGFSR